MDIIFYIFDIFENIETFQTQELELNINHLTKYGNCRDLDIQTKKVTLRDISLNGDTDVSQRGCPVTM